MTIILKKKLKLFKSPVCSESLVYTLIGSLEWISSLIKEDINMQHFATANTFPCIYKRNILNTEKGNTSKKGKYMYSIKETKNIINNSEERK